MAKHLVALLVGGLLLGSGLVDAAWAQQVPESVREQLQEQGMTVEEARRQAEQLGIDLSNPQQAARRARQLGIPEARIQALLQAYNQSMQQGQAAGMTGTQPQLRPTLSGGAVISPDTVLVAELPKTVNVRVRLRSETIITQVRPFFVSAVRAPGQGTTGGQTGAPLQQQGQQSPNQQTPSNQQYPNQQYPNQQPNIRRISSTCRRASTTRKGSATKGSRPGRIRVVNRQLGSASKDFAPSGRWASTRSGWRTFAA